MTGSVRRLGRSPVKRSEAMQLAVLEQQYILHHGALGHSPKTISHYQDSFRLLGRFITETGKTPTLWLRHTPTRG